MIERFDRKVEAGVVHRIHQEDFAQALGLPSELKYQRCGAPGRRLDVEAAFWRLHCRSDSTPAQAKVEDDHC